MKTIGKEVPIFHRGVGRNDRVNSELSEAKLWVFRDRATDFQRKPQNNSLRFDFNLGGSRLFRIAIIATIFLSAGLSAQQSPQAGAPVKLELRCPAPCTFRQGESIWFILDYTADFPQVTAF